MINVIPGIDTFFNEEGSKLIRKVAGLEVDYINSRSSYSSEVLGADVTFKYLVPQCKPSHYSQEVVKIENRNEPGLYELHIGGRYKTQEQVRRLTEEQVDRFIMLLEKVGMGIQYLSRKAVIDWTLGTKRDIKTFNRMVSSSLRKLVRGANK